MRLWTYEGMDESVHHYQPRRGFYTYMLPAPAPADNLDTQRRPQGGKFPWNLLPPGATNKGRGVVLRTGRALWYRGRYAGVAGFAEAIAGRRASLR